MDSLKGQHFLSLQGRNRDQLDHIFDVAKSLEPVAQQRTKLEIASGKILGTLFFESSTRTRLSFETAMHRLGGDVITVASAASSRVGSSYGETLGDTARVVDGYADVVAIRHKAVGAADEYARASRVPVIDAATGYGDGAKHPTQALIDLYTIKKEFGSIDGKTVMISGDMTKRVMQSLAYGLAYYDTKVYFAWPEDEKYRLPATAEETLGSMGLDYERVSSYDQVADEVDVIYGVGPALTWDEKSPDEFVYNLAVMETKAKPGAIVLHPLPRVDELAFDLDGTRYGRYFEEAHNGVPIRMALLALIVGLVE
jgi:aspartate carbamoyltransferase catalytic subunit